MATRRTPLDPRSLNHRDDPFVEMSEDLLHDWDKTARGAAVRVVVSRPVPMGSRPDVRSVRGYVVMICSTSAQERVLVVHTSKGHNPKLPLDHITRFEVVETEDERRERTGITAPAR